MNVKRWGSAVLAAGVAAALALVPTAAQAAPVTVNVTVGGFASVKGLALEGMRFLAPSNFTVHQGDTINFNFAGFHTATVLPADVGADDWRLDHTGQGGDYSLIQPDVGDAPNFEFNTTAAFPSSPSCGDTSTPCAYDGTSVVNSGFPNGPSFAVTVNEASGHSFWVVCLVHSMMQMRVTVVPDTTATTTQAQIDNYASKTMASDKDEARALIPKLEQQTRHKVGTNSYVWDAYAGFDGDGWGLDAMFPSSLHIKKGQVVRWHFSQLVGNIHTVTFPRNAANNFANNDFSGQRIKCDPGDTAPDAAPPVFCSSGTPEIEVRGTAVLTQGGANYYGTGLHSSGVRGPDGLTTHYYQLTFKKRSSSTGWKYACAIHGAMMSGAVIVS